MSKACGCFFKLILANGMMRSHEMELRTEGSIAQKRSMMHLGSRINWLLVVVTMLLWTVAVPLVFGSENVADAATQALPEYAVGVVD